MLEECRTLGGCPTGEAKITKGYNLPAKWVIHTVGPIWKGGHHGEDDALAQCYRNSLELAVEYSVRSIAFPSISTGAYGFPVERASGIAVLEIKDFLDGNSIIEKVVMVCFNETAYGCYSKAVNEIMEDCQKCLAFQCSGFFTMKTIII